MMPPLVSLVMWTGGTAAMLFAYLCYYVVTSGVVGIVYTWLQARGDARSRVSNKD
jgi:hypothetical protein